MKRADRKTRQSPESRFGAAYTNPSDAYRDVPILQRPTWHNEVAAYFFLGGISAGAGIIGSLAQIVGGKRHSRMARTAHYVSFAALIPCPPLLIDDLGVPGRFHHMLRIFKPSSPMNLGSWALTTHGAGATLTVLRMLAGEGKLPLVSTLIGLLPERALAALGLPSSLMLGGYTGVLLGTTSVPVWNTSQLLGGLFMASSLSTGASAVRLAAELTGRDQTSEEEPMPALGPVLGIAELALLTGYVATTGAAAKNLTTGRTGAMLWGAGGCTALSAVLEAASVVGRGRGRGAMPGVIAAASSLVGGALLRWAVVRAGAASAQDREGTLRAMKPREKSPGWGPPSPSTVHAVSDTAARGGRA